MVITGAVSNISDDVLEYWKGTTWKSIFEGRNRDRIKIHCFDRVWANK